MCWKNWPFPEATVFKSISKLTICGFCVWITPLPKLIIKSLCAERNYSIVAFTMSGGPTVKVCTIDNGAYLAVCCLLQKTFLWMDASHITVHAGENILIYRYFVVCAFFLSHGWSQIKGAKIINMLFSSEVVQQLNSHLNYTHDKNGEFEEEWKLCLAGCRMDRSWIYLSTVHWMDAHKAHYPFVDRAVHGAFSFYAPNALYTLSLTFSLFLSFYAASYHFNISLVPMLFSVKRGFKRIYSVFI